MNTYMLQNLSILDEIIQMAFLSIMNTVNAFYKQKYNILQQNQIDFMQFGLEYDSIQFYRNVNTFEYH